MLLSTVFVHHHGISSRNHSHRQTDWCRYLVLVRLRCGQEREVCGTSPSPLSFGFSSKLFVLFHNACIIILLKIVAARCGCVGLQPHDATGHNQSLKSTVFVIHLIVHVVNDKHVWASISKYQKKSNPYPGCHAPVFGNHCSEPLYKKLHCMSLQG